MTSIVNPVPLATAAVALLPAAVLFFVAYGRFDGLFRDNVVFLFFIGGLGLGALLSLAAVYTSVFAALSLVTLVPILYAVVPIAVLNRKKWQGERHSVFNGGALGLGLAAMTVFAFAYRAFATDGIAWRTVIEWGVLSLGLSGVELAAGLVLGAGVAERKPFRAVFLAAGLTGLAFVALHEYVRGGATLWPLVLAALGAAAAALGATRLMPKGVAPGAIRAKRRRERARGEP